MLIAESADLRFARSATAKPGHCHLQNTGMMR
jgi:hypothetical protein